MKANVSNELGLDQTASGTEDVLLGRRLNEAVREVLLRTHCYVKTGTITLAASDWEYELTDALSDDPLAIHNLLTSDSKPLERVPVDQIHELRRASTTSTATYTYRYAVDGANLLLIYPAPAAAGTLTVYYVPKPTEMSSGAHDPATATYGNIPVQWHDAIELWAMHKLGSYDDDASSQMGGSYLQQFEKRVTEIRLEMKKMGGRKMPRVRVSRRRYVSSDPART